jgi:hypothetical protein
MFEKVSKFSFVKIIKYDKVQINLNSFLKSFSIKKFCSNNSKNFSKSNDSHLEFLNLPSNNIDNSDQSKYDYIVKIRNSISKELKPNDKDLGEIFTLKSLILLDKKEGYEQLSILLSDIEKNFAILRGLFIEIASEKFEQHLLKIFMLYKNYILRILEIAENNNKKDFKLAVAICSTQVSLTNYTKRVFCF